jgi:8-oxo-dGTP pyrophosphatase MutT (NUDIX family)
MIYKFYFDRPQDFIPDVEVSGCFCEWDGKLLYLKRHADKPYGETWGLPAGKIEEGEDPRQAAVREVEEEVGIKLDPVTLQEVAKTYLDVEGLRYVFHAFRVTLDKAPQIRLEPQAHTEARWLTVEEALKLPLIIGGGEILKYYQAKISSS